MRFNVTLIEPSGERYAHFLFDMVRYLVGTLELLGHDCTLERNRCLPEAINVLVGIHLLQSPEDVAIVLGGARDYVVLQTEILEAAAINGVAVGERLDKVIFPLLRGARAVWDTLDTNVEVLRTKDIRADLLRVSYSPRLEEVQHKTHKDIDFLFYGSVGPWRRGILEKLSSLGYVVRAEFAGQALFRNDLIARSEIILTLRHGEEMGHLPQGRVIYAVNNACLVVGEGGYGQETLEDVFLWTNDPKDVVELCRRARGRQDRGELRRSFYEKLRERPMTSFMAPLVESLLARVA
jgi:hypothetical protein